MKDSGQDKLEQEKWRFSGARERLILRLSYRDIFITLRVGSSTVLTFYVTGVLRLRLKLCWASHLHTFELIFQGKLPVAILLPLYNCYITLFTPPTANTRPREVIFSIQPHDRNPLRDNPTAMNRYVSLEARIRSPGCGSRCYSAVSSFSPERDPEAV